MTKRVLVAMSGGVDSSVAALLLVKAGYDVSGVTMRLDVTGGECRVRRCSDAAVDDAKRVCDRLKIPHHVLDYADQLEEMVIAPFISEYLRGRTPNPCINCNRYLKFGSLLERARTLGFDYFATGHYAAVEKSEEHFYLGIPKERKKDQTYFLYAIPYNYLSFIIFPLAPLTKEEVKEIAKKASLPVAGKEESQDICFISQGNYQAFLSERIKMVNPGPIEDMEGNILGEHKGIIFYTVGQRGGLGISHKTPLYVIAIDAGRNRIVVGDKKDLKAKGLIAGNVNVLAPSWPPQVHAKIRYRKRASPCEAVFVDEKLKVIFSEEQEAITPGQSVVLYANDRVLGGGVIEEVLHRKDTVVA